jgi:transposase
LERRIAELEAQLAGQDAKLAEMVETIKELTAALEEARRSGKRQAAPFRKPKKENPQKPGRKRGKAHGQHAHRESIPEEQLDEIYDAPLPTVCPCCGSEKICEKEVAYQYQTEIPRRPIYRRFDIHIGECEECGARLQGRHELQTSDAVGAAASQLGPDAHSALSIMNKEMGLSHGKCAKIFSRLFGIEICRTTSVRSILRSAGRCKPAYGQIQTIARASPWNVPDETGWRIGGENGWLHVTISGRVSCYRIAQSRGHEVLAAILGIDYDGVLIRDGFRSYDCFRQAVHQLCLGHLLSRCERLLENANRGAVRFPRAVKTILKEALQLRERYRKGKITHHGLQVMRGRFAQKMRRLITPLKQHDGNERFAAHLRKHQDELFTFLAMPWIDATNWRAEQAIRLAVVNRKVWGGNRTDRGAEAQTILMSVIVTAHQNSMNSLDFISKTLRSTEPILLFNSETR